MNMESGYVQGKSEQQLEAEKKECAEYSKKLEILKGERSNFETNWQEVLDYVVPNKAQVTRTGTPGEKRGNLLFDTTAIHANVMLASALHSMLTNPETRFFDAVMADPKLNDDDDVKGWCQDVAQRIWNVLVNTNFQTEIHEIYIDLGSIGTACLYMGDHDDRVIHFNARPMKEIYVDENNLGLIDTVYRTFTWKAKQIVQEFGIDNCPKIVKDKYEKNDDQSFEIVHCVQPWMDEQPSPKGYKFESCYYLKEENLKLRESGFHEMPFAVPRWTKTSGEKYGRGPGMDMLPDIKMINAMQETTIGGAQLTIRPPMQVTDDGVIGKVKLTPAGLTVVRNLGGDAAIKPLITDARIDFGFQYIESVKKSIREGFFVNQMQLNQGPQMTATEVNQRVEEMLRFMGPILGRQHFELLGVMFNRIFGIMSRRGLLPEAPPQIQGKKVDARYSSLIARVQRMNEGQNIIRAINTAAPLFQLDPKTTDIIDGDAGVKHVFDVFGVPHKLLKSDRELKKMRDARDAANAQAAQQAQEAHQADVVSKTAPGAAQLAMAQQEKTAL